MPQVPYLPVPDVEPTQRSVGPASVNAPAAAFGGDIAAAIGGLGKAVEGAGNELFTRAYAMQQLQNEADARDADTNYMISAGKLHANFNALEGKDRVTQYDKYQQDLQSERMKFRNGLGNPQAQKMYDASSLNTMGRSIFSGANIAAEGQKSYSLNTLSSKADMDAQAIEDHPDDEGLYNHAVSNAHFNAINIASLKYGEHDPDSPIVKDLELRETSKYLSSKIIGKSKHDPFGAQTLLDSIPKGALRQDDYNRVSSIVSTKALSVGGTNIASDAIDKHIKPDGTLDVSTEELMNEVRDKAKSFDPNNPMLAQHAVATARTDLRLRQFAAERDKQDAIAQYKTAVINQDGTVVKNQQELMAKPGMDGLVQRLPPAVRNDIPGYIERLNKQQDAYSNDQTKIRINGMFNDPEQRGEALDLDLTKEHLSVPDIIKYQDKQAKLRNDLQGDPRVQHAVSLMQQGMGQELGALGINGLKKGVNDDDWNNFRGTVQGAIDSFTEDHKRRPTDEEFLTKIAPVILRQQTKPGMFWGTNKEDPIFKQPPSETWMTNHRADIIERGGANPSDEELTKLYHRELFMKLYGGKAKSSGE